VLRWLAMWVLFVPAAVAGDADVPDAIAPSSADRAVQLDAVADAMELQTHRPKAGKEIDVITPALWARFARRNGSDWWLHRKTIVDKQGHTQLDNAKHIVKRFRDAGLPDSIALAAVVNSLMESSLLSHRIHPRSKATGLFQCWRNPRVSVNLPGGGAGNGTPGFDWGSGPGLDATTAQMLDRDKNIDRILFELLHVKNTTGKEFFGVPPGEGFGQRILDRAAQGASVAELAGLWGQRIERYRPSPGGSYSFRGRVAEQLLGAEIAHADTSSWRKNTLPPDLDCLPPGAFDGLTLEHRMEPPAAGLDPHLPGGSVFQPPLYGGWLASQPEGCP